MRMIKNMAKVHSFGLTGENTLASGKKVNNTEKVRS